MLGVESQAGTLSRTFVARQPIFDSGGTVHGYELLFRDGPLTSVDEAELDAGTLRTLDAAFLVHGIEDLTGGLPAYLSFSTLTLTEDFALLFPASSIAVQIGPYVRFSDEVVNACFRLNRRGYKLVISDFARFSWLPANLLHFVDVVKVDCGAVDDAQLEGIAGLFRNHRAELAAENLDTQIGWRYAQQLGFSLFQGKFLGMPEEVVSADVAVSKAERLRLLQELRKDDLEPGTIEEIIKHDPTLSYKLLMFVNSAAMGVRNPIRNIRQAIMMFGRLGMLRWASVIALKDAGDGRPSELIRESLFRGRFCEVLAGLASAQLDSGEMFLLGLFSEIDLLLGRPLADILAALPLSEGLRAALAGEAGDERRVLEVCQAYERGDWALVASLAAAAGVEESRLPGVYQDAVSWSTALAA